VCTIEKANSIINKLLEDQIIKDLHLIIIDEFHLLFDKSRGCLIEMLVAKCRMISEIYKHDIKLVCMSATLTQMPLLTSWLRASTYECNIRPVPLVEHIVIGETLYTKDLKRICPIPKRGSSYDPLPIIVQAYLKCNESLIVFCATRKACEYTTESICKGILKYYPTTGKPESELSEKLINTKDPTSSDPAVLNERASIVEELKCTSVGVCPLLKKSIIYGVAYHNSDLTAEERQIIEKA
jgi:DNA polymerase theta